jgi:hypothetical protein
MGKGVLQDRTIKLKAEISTKMFGRGQKSSEPLYVNVTNQGRALGGPVSANKTYMVGEKGPEMFVSSTAGTIIPNDKLSSAGVGGGAVINVYPSERMDERALASVVSRNLVWSMRRGA